MGPCTSAAEAVRRREVRSKGMVTFGLFVLCASLATHATPSDSLHARVYGHLAAGDTLLALDVLQDPAEHALDPEWADALLDRLVLPDRTPRSVSLPPTAARKGPRRWNLRIEGAHVSDSSGRAYQAGSMLAEHAWSFSNGHQRILAGLRLDGFLGEQSSIAGITPRLGWAIAAGRHEALARAWTMLANDLDPDAGLDLAWRLRTDEVWWIGSRANLSLEGNQDVLFGTGVDQDKGSWSWSSSLELGAQMARLPRTSANRTIGIDSIIGFDVYMRHSRDTLYTRELPLLAWNEGTDAESITPFRLRVVGRAQLLWGSKDFRLGPGVEFDGRASLQEDTWIPGMRSLWPDGTTFLATATSAGKMTPISREGDVYAPATSKVGTYQDLHLSPTLNATIGSSERIWTSQATVGWNLPFASAEGHPLEDTREGLEVRASSQLRW